VITPVERQGELGIASRSIADKSATKRVTKPAANPTTITQAEVQQAWTAYRTTEKHGVELGRVLFEYRETHKSKGGFGSEGKGLVQLLNELVIPRSTAYWWIDRYEISVGLKAPKETQLPPVPSTEATQSFEPEGEPQSGRETNPDPEPEPESRRWNRKQERWKGRNDPPLTDDAEIERLALKIVDAGYKALMETGGGGEYRTHLWRAQEEAKEAIRTAHTARTSAIA
jgi:hypothetical protein